MPTNKLHLNQQHFLVNNYAKSNVTTRYVHFTVDSGVPRPLVARGGFLSEWADPSHKTGVYNPIYLLEYIAITLYFYVFIV